MGGTEIIMKKFISIILAIAAIAANTVFAADYPQKFYDVPKDFWAFEYIADLADRGVISGYEDGSFKPNRTVSRAEWAKIMVDAAGVTVNDNSVKFNDMQDHWANKYVNAAKNYLTGYTDGSYRPNQAATREDVTVAMVRLKGYDLSEVDYSYLGAFTDNDSISNYAKGYVAVAIAENLISGFEDGTFRGQDTLTRAEAATLLYRAFKHGNADKVVDIADTPAQTPAPSKTAAPEKNDEYKQQAESAKKTPKPTKQPTPEPTEEPTPEPTEEPTPEPTETPKPYAVDTVVKADVGGYLQYSKDDDDNIYYNENNAVYKTNINDKNKDKIIDGKDIVIDNEEMTLSDFVITSVCYDDYRDKILVTGNFETVNAAGNINNRYLCAVSENGFEVLTDHLPASDCQLVKVLDDGNYVCYSDEKNLYGKKYLWNAIISAETYEVTSGIYIGRIYDAYDENTNLYIYYNGSIYRYDYKEVSSLWMDSLYCAALKKDMVVGANSDGINTYNFKGKKLKTISYDDIAVFDRVNLDFQNQVRAKMFLTNDDNLVFYDISAKAFRIIKPNED